MSDPFDLAAAEQEKEAPLEAQPLEAPPVPEAPPAPEDPFDQAAAAQAEDRQFKIQRFDQVRKAVVDPNRQAAVLSLVRQTGAPREFVEHEFDFWKARAEAGKEQTPEEFYRNNDGWAEIALENPFLGEIITKDKPLNTLQATLRGFRKLTGLTYLDDLERSQNGGVQFYGQDASFLRTFDPAAYIPGELPGVSPKVEKETLLKTPLAQATGLARGEIYVDAAKRSFEPIELGWLTMKYAAQRLAGADTYETEMAAAELKNRAVPLDYEAGPGEQVFLDAAQFFGSHVVSLGTTILGGVAGKAIGLGVKGAQALGFGTGFASSFVMESSAFWDFKAMTDDKGRPVDDDTALGMAVGYASVSAVIETGVNVGQWLPFLKLGGKKAAGEAVKEFLQEIAKDPVRSSLLRAGLRKWAKTAAAEGLEEASQGLAQDIFGWMSKSRSAGLREGGSFDAQKTDMVGSLGEGFDTWVTATVGSFIMAGGPAARNAYVMDREARRSVLAAVQIRALNAAIPDSPTVQAAPQVVADMVARETEASGEKVDAIYLDPAGLTRLAQEQNLDAAELVEQAIGKKAAEGLREALAAGGMLRVPMAEYIDAWHKSGLADALVDDATTRAAGVPTRNQQRERSKEFDAEVEAQLKLIEEDKTEATPYETLLANMAKEVADAQKGIGKGDAKTLTAIWRAMVKTAAESSGLERDDVARMLSVKIAKDPKVKGNQRVQSLVQGALEQGRRVDTGAAAFKSWFKKSRVVDAKGKPLRVFHGTYVGDLREWNGLTPGRFRRGTDKMGISIFDVSQNGGAAFTNDPRLAEVYGDSLHPVYLSLQNPLDVSDVREYHTAEEWLAILRERGVDTSNVRVKVGSRTNAWGDGQTFAFWGLLTDLEESDNNLRQELEKQGFDGIISQRETAGLEFPEGEEPVVYFAFRKEQIKSVLNRGTWSEETGNILDQEAQALLDKVVEALASETVAPSAEVLVPPGPTRLEQLERDLEWDKDGNITKASIKGSGFGEYLAQVRAWMEKNRYTEKEIKAHLRALEGQLKIFKALGAQNLTLLPADDGRIDPKTGQPRKRSKWGPIRSNVDPIYRISFDASAMCVKRLEASATQAYVQEKLNRPLTASERIALVAFFREAGKTAPCLYCYVESPRAKAGDFMARAMRVISGEEKLRKDAKEDEKAAAKKAIAQFKKLGLKIEDINPNFLLDPDTARTAEAQRRVSEHAAIYDYLEQQGLYAKANQPKLYSEYRGHILGVKQQLITDLNKYAGFRFFSTSDFQAEHVIDLIQAFQDLALRKARAHAYTKVPDFIRIFGRTGMKIQMSLFAKEVNGEFVEDTSQGMGWEEAKEFRKRYKNVGAVFVATSDAQVRWALDQKWIDYIIPFHYSGLESKYYKELNWDDFTSTQGEKKVQGLVREAGPKKFEVVFYGEVVGTATSKSAAAAIRRNYAKKVWQAAIERRKKKGEKIPTVTVEKDEDSGLFRAYLNGEELQDKEGQTREFKTAEAAEKAGDKAAAGKQTKIRMWELGAGKGISDEEMSRRYLALARRKGIEPVFPSFAGHPNYAKLKKDYSRSDTPFEAINAKRIDLQEAGKVLQTVFAGTAPKAKVDEEIGDRLYDLIMAGHEELGVAVLRALQAGVPVEDVLTQIGGKLGVPAGASLVNDQGKKRTTAANILEQGDFNEVNWVHPIDAIRHMDAIAEVIPEIRRVGSAEQKARIPGLIEQYNLLAVRARRPSWAAREATPTVLEQGDFDDTQVPGYIPDTPAQFLELGKQGKLHQATGKSVPGEEAAQSPFEMGVLNGYTVQDIAHFYLVRRGIFPGINGKKPRKFTPAQRDAQILDAMNAFIDDVAYAPRHIRELAAAPAPMTRLEQGDLALPAKGPIWRSAALEAASNAKQEVGTPESWWAVISKTPGVKEEELRYMGLKDWLDEAPLRKESLTTIKTRPGMLHKKEVMTFLLLQQVNMRETILEPREASEDDPPRDVENAISDLRQFDIEVEWNGFETAERYRLSTALMGTEQTWMEIEEFQKTILEDGEIFTPAQLGEIDAAMTTVGEAHPDEDPYFNAQEGSAMYQEYSSPFLVEGSYREMLFYTDASKEFVSDHFGGDGEGLLGHVRFGEVRGPDGKRVLFIEEVQSDLHEAARERGYANNDEVEALKKASLKAFEAVDRLRQKLYRQYQIGADFQGDAHGELLKRMTEQEAMKLGALEKAHRDASEKAAKAEDSIPDAPFKKTWEEMMVKRMIRYAAENGYDRISWTTGAQQAARYNLEKHISSLSWQTSKGEASGETLYSLSYVRPGNRAQTPIPGLFPADKIHTVVGRELAARITTNGAPTGKLEGIDLRIGGEGMKFAYDSKLPKIMEKLIGKYGGKVELGQVQEAPKKEPLKPVVQGFPNGRWTVMVHPPHGHISTFNSEAAARAFAAERTAYAEEMELTAMALGGGGPGTASVGQESDGRWNLDTWEGPFRTFDTEAEAQAAMQIYLHPPEGIPELERDADGNWILSWDDGTVDTFDDKNEARQAAEAFAKRRRGPPTVQVWTATLPESLRREALEKGMPLFQEEQLFRGRPAEEGVPSEEARFGPAYYYADDKRPAKVFAEFRGEGAYIEELKVELDHLKMWDDRGFDVEMWGQGGRKDAQLETPEGRAFINIIAADLDLSESVALAMVKSGGIMEVAREYRRRREPVIRKAQEELRKLQVEDNKLPGKPVVGYDDARLSKEAREAFASRSFFSGSKEVGAALKEAGFGGIIIPTAGYDDVPGHTEYAFFKKPSAEITRLLQAGFHGTPHAELKGGKFSLKYVNSGEGTTHEGWGLYFTQSKDVAEWYRQQLVKRHFGGDTPKLMYKGKEFSEPAFFGEFAENLGMYFWEDNLRGKKLRARVLQNIKDSIEYLEELDDKDELTDPDDAARLAEAHESLRWAEKLDFDAFREGDHGASGKVYKVELPDMEKLLDRDAGMSEQPAGVLEKLKKAGLLPVWKVEKRKPPFLETGRGPPVREAYWYSAFVAGERIVTYKARSKESAEKNAAQGNESALTTYTGRDVYERLVEAMRRKHFEGENYDWEKDPMGIDPTGWRANALAKEYASKALLKAGIPGLIYQGEGGKGQHKNFVIWDEKAIALLEAFEQDPNAGAAPAAAPAPGPRGWLETAQAAGKRLVNIFLTEKADMSTFLHESAHAFWELKADLAERPDASARVKADYEAALRFMGVSSRQELADRSAQANAIRTAAESQNRLLTREEKAEILRLVEPFEKWARGFEKYLMEGKAPSLALVGAFTQFKLWLFEVYKTALGLNVNLDDEIRGVFDRMLATDKEIEAAARQIGVTGPAVDAAKSRAEVAALKEAARVHEKWWKKALEEATDAAEEAFEALPEVRAWKLLRKGEGTEKERKALADAKLDRRAVADILGSDVADKKFRSITQRFDPATGEAGVHPDHLAAVLGAPGDGAALLKAMAALPSKAEWVKARAEATMAAKHPGILDEKERLDALVQKAIHDEPGVVDELHKQWAEDRKGAGAKDTPSVDTARAAARVLIRKQLVQALDPSGYKRAERTWAMKRAALGVKASEAKAKLDSALGAVEKAKQAIKEAKAKEGETPEELQARVKELDERLSKAEESLGKAQEKHQEAAAAKADASQRRLLNFYLWKEAERALKMTESTREVASRALSTKGQQLLGKAAAAYRDVTLRLLEAAGFVKNIPDEARQAGLDDLQRAFNALESGEEETEASLEFDRLTIQALLQTPKAFDDMTVAEADELHKALTQIFAGAREQTTILIDGQRKALEEVVANVGIESARLPLVDKPAQDRMLATIKQSKFWGAVRGWLAMKRDPLTTWLDDDWLGQTVRKAVRDRYYTQRDVEDELLLTAGNAVLEAYEKMPPAMRARMGDVIDASMLKMQPGRSGLVSRSWMYQVLANWGNLQNRQRLLDGREWTEEQVMELFRVNKLTREECEFIQGIWDLNDKFLWPRIAEVFTKVKGSRPAKVEASPFQLILAGPGGREVVNMRGGYYPLMADPAERGLGRKQEKDVSVNEASYEEFRASLLQGFTQGRVKKAKYVVRLDDFGVYPAHVGRVIRYIAWEEYVRDTGRLFAALKDTVIIPRLGQQVWNQLDAWLKVVASGNPDTIAAADAALGEVFGPIVHRTVKNAMMLNIKNAIADLVNPVFSVFGPSGTRTHFFRYLTPTLLEASLGIVAPKGTGHGFWAMREQALERFSELKSRQKKAGKKVRKAFERISAAGRRWQPAKSLGSNIEPGRLLDWTDDHGFVLQETSAAWGETVVAHAAYLQAGGDFSLPVDTQDPKELEARRRANDAVQKMFPSDKPAERSRAMRSKGIMGAFTMMQGFFNRVDNMVVRAAHPAMVAWANAEGWTEKRQAAMPVVTSGLMVAGIFGTLQLLGGIVEGRGPEPDESTPEWVKRKLAGFFFVLDPVGAQFANFVEASVASDPAIEARLRFSASERSAPAVSTVLKVFKNMGTVVDGDQESEKRFWATYSTLAFVLGLPESQVKRTGRAIMEGDPTLESLIYGPEPAAGRAGNITDPRLGQ